MMTTPITRSKQLSNSIQDAITRLCDFQRAVAEIRQDPFTAGPSQPVLDACECVRLADIQLRAALDAIEKLGAAAEADRPSEGLVVDDGAKDAA